MNELEQALQGAEKVAKSLGLLGGGAFGKDPMTLEDGSDFPDDGAGNMEKVPGIRMEAITASRQIQDDVTTWQTLVDQGAVLSPPYDPHALLCTVEESGALPFLIDTMATNIGGFGAELVALYETRDKETGKEIEPPPEALEEKARLERFLKLCKVPDGIEGVMDRTDRDVESIGWGGIEVLRTTKGRVAGLEPMRGKTLRLGGLSDPIMVDVPFRDPETGEIALWPTWRRFRTLVQLQDGVAVYFREFGDPRPINRKTGKYGEPGKRFGGGLDGTECMFIRIYSPHTAYGVPRWLGAAPHARAEREASDLILSWFLDSPIGVKLAMVSGGSWNEAKLKKAFQKIDRIARGKENAWTIVGLEAESADGGGAFSDTTGTGGARMMLEDLVMELPSELHFGEGNLIDASVVRLARMFRLPPIYYGASGDYNRATVTSAKSFGEEQVMRPIRRLRWENRWNNEILPAMNVNHWAIRLKGANTSDDTEIAKSIQAFVAGGGASPNALIELWNELTGQEVTQVTEAWGDRPFALTTALITGKMDPNAGLGELVEGFEADKAAQAEQLAALNEQKGGGGGGGFGGGDEEEEDDDAPPKKITAAQKAAIGTAAQFVGDMMEFRSAALEELAEMDPNGTWWG